MQSGQSGFQGDRKLCCEDPFVKETAGVRGHAWSVEEWGELLVRELGTDRLQGRRTGVEVNLDSGGG